MSEHARGSPNTAGEITLGINIAFSKVDEVGEQAAEVARLAVSYSARRVRRYCDS